MTRDINDFISDKRKFDPDIDRELLELGNYTDLALTIHRLRVSQGLSQRDLANKLGTSQVNIVRWETPGYTSYTVRSLEKLSRALGVALKVDFEEVPSQLRLDKSYKLTPQIDDGPGWSVIPSSDMVSDAAANSVFSGGAK